MQPHDAHSHTNSLALSLSLTRSSTDTQVEREMEKAWSDKSIEPAVVPALDRPALFWEDRDSLAAWCSAYCTADTGQLVPPLTAPPTLVT